MTRFDAVIVGGGPAGAATALSLLRRGHAAAIVESSGYHAERIGEALAPPARGMLEHLGVWDAFVAAGDHLEAYGTRAVWGGDAPGANPFVLSTHGHGWQLERRAFDALLVNAAAAAGASVHRHARLEGSRRTPAGWRLTIRRADGTVHRLEAATVVDATGRGARFALAQGAHKLVDDRLVGVSGVFERVPDPLADAGVLVEACRDGWWYSARLPGERAIVAFLSDADIVGTTGLRAPATWAAALRRRPHTLARVSGAAWPTRLAVHSARTQRLDCVAGSDWLAVGDAAATIDPLSSQGILSALHGGIFASYAIEEWIRGDVAALARYAAFVTSAYEASRVAAAVHYGREGRWAGAPFWTRRRAA